MADPSRLHMWQLPHLGNLDFANFKNAFSGERTCKFPSRLTLSGQYFDKSLFIGRQRYRFGRIFFNCGFGLRFCPPPTPPVSELLHSGCKRQMARALLQSRASVLPVAPDLPGERDRDTFRT